MLPPALGLWRSCPSPVERPGEVFGNQVFVKRAKLRDVRLLVALGVEIIRIELAHRIEQSLILLIHQILVIAFAVRGVERVIAQHIERFVRQMILRDVIDIFVVSPREVHFVETRLELKIENQIRRLIEGHLEHTAFGAAPSDCCLGGEGTEGGRLGPGTGVYIGQIVPGTGNSLQGVIQSGLGISKYGYTWPTVALASAFEYRTCMGR